MAKKWIQKAIKKPGALHRQMGIPEGQTIPVSRLRSAAKKGGTLGRRARLALTLRKIRTSKHSPSVDHYTRVRKAPHTFA